MIDFENWQAYAGSIMVDHRTADDLIANLKLANGFTIRTGKRRSRKPQLTNRRLQTSAPTTTTKDGTNDPTNNERQARRLPPPLPISE